MVSEENTPSLIPPPNPTASSAGRLGTLLSFLMRVSSQSCFFTAGNFSPTTLRELKKGSILSSAPPSARVCRACQCGSMHVCASGVGGSGVSLMPALARPLLSLVATKVNSGLEEWRKLLRKEPSRNHKVV